MDSKEASRPRVVFFYDPLFKIKLGVHGDDFTAVGTRKALADHARQQKAIFDLKVSGRLDNAADTHTQRNTAAEQSYSCERRRRVL